MSCIKHTYTRVPKFFRYSTIGSWRWKMRQCMDVTERSPLKLVCRFTSVQSHGHMYRRAKNSLDLLVERKSSFTIRSTFQWHHKCVNWYKMTQRSLALVKAVFLSMSEIQSLFCLGSMRELDNANAKKNESWSFSVYYILHIHFRAETRVNIARLEPAYKMECIYVHKSHNVKFQHFEEIHFSRRRKSSVCCVCRRETFTWNKKCRNNILAPETRRLVVVLRFIRLIRTAEERRVCDWNIMVWSIYVYIYIRSFIRPD